MKSRDVTRNETGQNVLTIYIIIYYSNLGPKILDFWDESVDFWDESVPNLGRTGLPFGLV
jgi:hypothetical protein